MIKTFATRVIGVEEGLNTKELQIRGNMWRTEVYSCPEELACGKLISTCLHFSNHQADIVQTSSIDSITPPVLSIFQKEYDS